MNSLLSRFRSRLDFATVASVIAIVAVLGGSGAIAFSGSGTLQKANKLGILNSTTNFEMIRTLNGIGSVEAQCRVDGANDSVTVRLNNNTDNILSIPQFSYAAGLGFTSGIISPGDQQVFQFNTSLGAQTFRIHIGRTGGLDAKVPQADLILNATPPAGDSCTTAQVAVFVLNTEE